MTILSLINICKSFEKTQALAGVTFDVSDGEIIALLGPSGCGKSTLLSIIAGLELPDSGSVMWNNDSVVDTPPHLRDFGLMFQDFALFPHMNVYANVAFGLRMARKKSEYIRSRVDEMLELVGLPDFSYRDVNTLSGGEQQRVALARALAPHPRLLMLDEPLGSLDRNLREQLVIDLQSILHPMHQTAIYVTHDQEEAFTIADRVILMNSGQVVQIGTPQEIYCDPASPFVARFLEMNNLIPGIVMRRENKQVAISKLGEFQISSVIDGPVSILIRPDMARLDDSGPLVLHGLLQEASFRGSLQRISITIDQTSLSFEFPSNISLPGPGQGITISLDPDIAIKIFPGN